MKDNDTVLRKDLLIDRSDGVINLCEMKYTKSPFIIDAAYDVALQSKKAIFAMGTHTKKAVHLTMVSAEGIMRNSYSDGLQNIVTADDLFRE